MKEIFDKVREFHKLSNQPILDKPIIPSTDRCILRYTLLDEEVLEFEEACDNKDIVEVLDAFTDICYVLTGAMLEFGITPELFEKTFNEVHRSNMSKSIDLSHEALERELEYFTEEKKIKVDTSIVNGRRVFHNAETGKLLKPSSYSPADLKQFFNEI